MTKTKIPKKDIFTYYEVLNIVKNIENEYKEKIELCKHPSVNNRQ